MAGADSLNRGGLRVGGWSASLLIMFQTSKGAGGGTLVSGGFRLVSFGARVSRISVWWTRVGWASSVSEAPEEHSRVCHVLDFQTY